MLRLIAGLENPNYGAVFLHGLDTEKRRIETRQTVAFIPHDIDLDPWLTLEQNIQFDARLYGEHKDKIQSRINDYSHALELGEFLYSMAGRVPQGIQKKAMIIRALAHDPSILIMDEPTAGLDPNQIQEVRNTMSRLGKDRTILLSTHIMQEVEAMASRVIMINEGDLVYDGAMSALTKDDETLDQAFRRLTIAADRI